MHNVSECLYESVPCWHPGEETLIGDHSFQYMTMEDMKVLKDDSVPAQVSNYSNQ